MKTRASRVEVISGTDVFMLKNNINKFLEGMDERFSFKLVHIEYTIAILNSGEQIYSALIIYNI